MEGTMFPPWPQFRPPSQLTLRPFADYGITPEVIQRDLTNELPQWILSCYGPGKDAPEQIFGGFPREQSFEEIRMFFMEGLAKGNPQGAVSELAIDERLLGMEGH